MSPRRRLFAIALLVGALGGTAALVLAAMLGGGTAAPPVGQAQTGPVLLVPGYGGSLDSVAPLAQRLRAAGRMVEVIALPGGGIGDLTAQARALGDAVRTELEASGAPSVDLVGFSAGGVVARIYVRDLGGGAVVRRVVTLGSPHHGTELAALGAAFGAGVCPVACVELAPGSPLLRRLNGGDETPAGPLWVSVWSRYDATVTPPESGRLAGAVDVPLQDVCPDARTVHGDLPRDPLPVGVVLQSVGVATPRALTAGDCDPLRQLGAG